MVSTGLCAAAALIGGFLPYIENLFPLQNVVAESDVVTGVVERLDLQGKTCIVKITKPLKGKPPYAQIRMDLSKGWNPWERDAILKHLVPGAPVVVFDGIRTGQAAPSADKRKALIFVNRFFMKFSGKRESSPEKEVWEFEQIEIMLNRTFNGTAEELSAVVLGSLTGKQKAPAPDLRIPHIKKEDVSALPPPGAKVAEAQLPPPFRRSAPPPRAAENPAKAAPGLRFEYYEGTWKEVPDFAALPPALKGVTPQFEPSERRRDKNIGFRFTGFLEVPKDGTYTFSMASPGAHRIFFGKTELSLLVEKHVVDAAIDLKAGRHAITVCFADGGAGGNLKVSWEGPGLGKQPVPAAALYHAP